MSEKMKDGLLFAVKGLGLATLGASVQTLITIGVNVLWQIPLVLGFGYLTYSSGKQVYSNFKKVD